MRLHSNEISYTTFRQTNTQLKLMHACSFFNYVSNNLHFYNDQIQNSLKITVFFLHFQQKLAFNNLL